MNFNFELILFYAVLICGALSLFDMIFFAKNRRLAYEAQTRNMKNRPEMKYPLIIEYARSFFPVLLLVFILRSFLYEPFRIPSGSLEPTLLIGDFVLVNKFDYGLRVPVAHNKIVKNSDPQRGDIIVFRWPPNPSINYIKRVVGVPGDHLRYVNKVLYVNGKIAAQVDKDNLVRTDEQGTKQDVLLKQEDLLGVKHNIYQFKNLPSEDFDDIVVPQGQYFAMGDNRDDSSDSRFWGFVPDENIVGKAVMTWMSWNGSDHRIRWDRIFKSIT